MRFIICTASERNLQVSNHPSVYTCLNDIFNVQAFLEGEYAAHLSSDDKVKLVTGVGERVTSRFYELAKELVTVVGALVHVADDVPSVL